MAENPNNPWWFPQPIVTGGPVLGPAGATDNAIVLFDGTTGTLLKDSGVLLSSLASLTGVQAITNKTSYNGLVITPNTGVVTTGEWQATPIADAFISSSATWNAKEPGIVAGLASQYWRGDKTWQTLDSLAVTENTNLYFTNSRAIAATLTGYVSGAGVVSAADSVLSAIQKLNGNIGAIVSGVSSVNSASGAVVITVTGTANRISVSGGTGITPTIDISSAYVGQNTITTLGTVGTGVWQGTSITTSYTDAKIKGTIAASNRIIFGSGVADTVTDSANITYNGTTLAILGNLTVAQTGVPFVVNSTNSNIKKQQFTDNGTSRGYIGASSLYCFTAYESTGAAMRLGVTSAGNLLVGPTASGGADIVGEFLRTVAATAQIRITNASTSNGAYTQYTVYNTAANIINLGVVNTGTTTSGVYVQAGGYNMATGSGGYSMGTLNAAGVVRVYGGNGVLSFTIDSSSHFEVADAKNIKFNTSTGSKIADATTQKFAFWNNTPIVQPTTAFATSTFVANASANILYNESTFDGYTVAQAIKILRTVGLFA